MFVAVDVAHGGAADGQHGAVHEAGETARLHRADGGAVSVCLTVFVDGVRPFLSAARRIYLYVDLVGAAVPCGAVAAELDSVVDEVGGCTDDEHLVVAVNGVDEVVKVYAAAFVAVDADCHVFVVPVFPCDMSAGCCAGDAADDEPALRRCGEEAVAVLSPNAAVLIGCRHAGFRGELCAVGDGCRDTAAEWFEVDRRRHVLTVAVGEEHAVVLFGGAVDAECEFRHREVEARAYRRGQSVFGCEAQLVVTCGLQRRGVEVGLRHHRDDASALVGDDRVLACCGAYHLVPCIFDGEVVIFTP